MNMLSSLARLGVGGALVCLCASVGSAQRLAVTVRDSMLRTGVAAAVITAVEQQNGMRVYGITDAAGQASLKLPSVGVWTASVRRIGILPAAAAPVRVDTLETVAVGIAVRNARFTLPAVRVSARAGACGRAAGSDDRTAALWEQVTLALRTATLIRADSAVAAGLRVVLFDRTLDRARKVQRVQPLRSGSARGRPFFAADPDSLARFGYVRRERDGTLQYFAPDEVVLLSDAFVRTHCFEAPPVDADARLAELHFRPSPDRSLPEVAGVAFVDAESGELRRIEFRFVNVDQLYLGLRPDAGGDVSLRRLPDGRWIVSDWTIRMPTFLRTAWRGADALTGYREVGGTIGDADATALEPLQVAIADTAAAASPQPDDADVSRVWRANPDSGADTASTRTKTYQFGRIPGSNLSGQRVMVTPENGRRADATQPSSHPRSAGARATRGDGITSRIVEVRSGFEMRRRFGIGEFLDSTALARPLERSALDLLPLLPHVTLFYVPADVPAPPADGDVDLAREWRSGAQLPMVPVGTSDSTLVSLCLVKLFLDDKRASVQELRQLSATDIAAIEFYRDPRDVPNPFRPSGNTCGTAVLWSYSDLRSVR